MPSTRIETWTSQRRAELVKIDPQNNTCGKTSKIISASSGERSCSSTHSTCAILQQETNLCLQLQQLSNHANIKKSALVLLCSTGTAQLDDSCLGHGKIRSSRLHIWASMLVQEARKRLTGPLSAAHNAPKSSNLGGGWTSIEATNTVRRCTATAHKPAAHPNPHRVSFSCVPWHTRNTI